MKTTTRVATLACPADRVNREFQAGTSDWRLRLRSMLDLEVLTYNRTSDGLLAGLHDLVPLQVVRTPGAAGNRWATGWRCSTPRATSTR